MYTFNFKLENMRTPYILICLKLKTNVTFINGILQQIEFSSSWKKNYFLPKRVSVLLEECPRVVEDDAGKVVQAEGSIDVRLSEK